MGWFSFVFGKSSAAQRAVGGTSPADAGGELRNLMLSTPAERFGAKPSAQFPRVYGVLLDWPLGENTATVFAASTGDASLYTTTTFGILGGGGHATVRAAATAFVRAADRLYDSAVATSVFPYPAADRVRFYLLTYEGVRVVDTGLAEIQHPTSKYANFFSLGQAVVAELRLITQRQ